MRDKPHRSRLAHPHITEHPARVRASGFGEYSIDVEIFAYVGTADWNDFLAVQEDIVLRIMDIVKKAGNRLRPSFANRL